MAQKVSGPVGLPPNDYKTGPKGEPMTPIPSATLVVLCRIGSSQGKDAHSGYATLVVQRSNKQGGSFRSAVVFPGGLLDLADEHAIDQDAQRTASSSQGQGGEKIRYLRSLQLCALRETFEETGLLLLPASGARHSRAIGHVEAHMSSEEWRTMRKEVHDDARAFTPFLRRVQGIVDGTSSTASSSRLPALAPMQHYSNWVTPRNICRPGKRFDTHFFITVLDEADALGPLSSAASSKSGEASSSKGAGRDVSSISADGSETTSIRLATPEEIMHLAVRDEIVLFPPQYYILSDIRSTLEAHTHSSSQKALRFPPLRFGQSEAEAAERIPETPTDLPARPRFDEVLTRSEPTIKTTGSSNIERSRLQLVRNSNAGNDGEDDKDAPVFVFPLVLPGDTCRPLRGSRASPPRLNRVYVTPRTKGEGGGLMVHGAKRRGMPGLRDFEYGTCPPEMDVEADPDEGNFTSKL